MPPQGSNLCFQLQGATFGVDIRKPRATKHPSHRVSDVDAIRHHLPVASSPSRNIEPPRRLARLAGTIPARLTSPCGRTGFDGESSREGLAAGLICKSNGISLPRADGVSRRSAPTGKMPSVIEGCRRGGSMGQAAVSPVDSATSVTCNELAAPPASPCEAENNAAAIKTVAGRFDMCRTRAMIHIHAPRGSI